MLLHVHLSVTQVDQSKMVKLRVIQVSLNSPIPLVFAVSQLCVNISKTVRDTSKVTIND